MWYNKQWNTMNNAYNLYYKIHWHTIINMNQYETINNKIQHTILPINYNKQLNTMSNDNNYDTIYDEIQCKIEYNIQYNTTDSENNMIQWTIWYNVQYSIIAYNITIQYNRQLVQYQTI